MSAPAAGVTAPLKPGEVRPVAPNILRIRVPLPFRLDHVNCWILEDGDGWAVVDCGIASADVAAMWTALAVGPLADRPIRRLIATHGHTDHVGFAGTFVDMFSTSFEASLTEWMAPRLRRLEGEPGARRALHAFLASHGCGEALIAAYEEDKLRVTRFLGPQPGALRRLRDGDVVDIGGRGWTVMVGEGHADEHVSFFCAEARVLIAGDQVLPGISPVIIVGPGEPDANPLGGYLRSLKTFERLPADTLVLPSHGEPFVGLHARLTNLADHHASRLDDLERMLDAPRTASDASALLFARAVKEGAGRLALAETLAHLHLLTRRSRAERHEVDGVFLFSAPR